jgi:hypothetical protein
MPNALSSATILCDLFEMIERGGVRGCHRIGAAGVSGVIDEGRTVCKIYYFDVKIPEDLGSSSFISGDF